MVEKGLGFYGPAPESGGKDPAVVSLGQERRHRASKKRRMEIAKKAAKARRILENRYLSSSCEVNDVQMPYCLRAELRELHLCSHHRRRVVQDSSRRRERSAGSRPANRPPASGHLVTPWFGLGRRLHLAGAGRSFPGSCRKPVDRHAWPTTRALRPFPRHTRPYYRCRPRLPCDPRRD